MKKHLSVLMFYTKQKIYKVILIVLAMAGIQIAGYKLTGLEMDATFGSGNGSLFFKAVFFTAYLLVVFASIDIRSKRSKPAYTIERLRVSEPWIFLWDSLASVMMFVILYCAEIITLCLISADFMNAPGYIQGPQGIIAAFYRDDFLHAVIPMIDKWLWIRNLLYLAAAGTGTAFITFESRHGGRFTATAMLTLTYIVLSFSMDNSSGGMVYSVFIVLLAICAPIRVIVSGHKGSRRTGDDGKA